jgi:predicted N-acetyltransferase YhbS
MIQIRFAKAEDAKELEEIDKIAHRELKWWGMVKASEFKNIIRKSNKRLIVAVLEGTIIGYLHSRFDREKDKKVVWIEDIYVLKEFRERHIAKKLISFFIKLHKSKAEGVALLTGDRNVKIFEKLGFEKSMNYMSIIFDKRGKYKP